MRCFTKIRLFALLLIVAPSAFALPSLDAYGGRTDITCTNTGWFHTQKIAKRWWVCDPLGNVFFPIMIDGVVPNAFLINVATKYGSEVPAWTEEANARVMSWGFNTLGWNAYGGNFPWATDPSFPLDSHGLHSQPVKMPFVWLVRPSYYSMLNPIITTNSSGNLRLLTNPVKNMLAVHSSFYPDYVYTAIGDYFDSGIGTWLLSDLQNDSAMAWFNNGSPSPYVNYLVGMEIEDGDEIAGFTTSPAFTTDPPGKASDNLGMLVATGSPLETANSCVELNDSCSSGAVGYVYTNTQIYSKLQLESALKTEYTTIAALNAAWGSSYTTFDSSGTCVGSQPITCASSVAADSVGTGNGSTLTFSATLTHHPISPCSLQILVAATPVAGDDTVNGYPGDGCTSKTGILWGPNASGTINYSTGAISITFTSGNAPANSAAITATDVENGWGIGTGFLDEDNRTSHNSYFGTDWLAMSNATPQVLTDMNTFVNSAATQFFSTCRTDVNMVLPNIMYLGPNSLNNWGVPSPAPVLQAAANYIDAFLSLNDANQFSQAMMNYVATYYGDKPYFGGWYTSANPDSAESAGTSQAGGSGIFTTQATRGATYITQMGNILTGVPTSSGNFPYIGMEWFDYVDFGGTNWGVVTPSDNSYNAVEPATGSVTCSSPLQEYTCGSEPIPASGGGTPPFGNLITSVTAANQLWLGQLGVTASISGATLSGAVIY